MSSERTVLVTGASGGVGRGIALACAEAGWSVWIAARRQEAGLKVASEIDAAGGHGRFVSCDVADRQSVEEAVARVIEADGSLHGVVHNSTSSLSPVPSVLAEMTLDELDEHAAVSVRGMFLLAQASFAHLRAVGGAYIALTSEAGFEGKAKLPAYAAVKGAQRGLARALAREWGPHGVRVNCIAPLASTPAMETAFVHDPEMAQRVLGRNPLGRLGDAVSDIGPVVRFLLSNEARYLTGNTLMVDGGGCPIS